MNPDYEPEAYHAGLARALFGPCITDFLGFSGAPAVFARHFARGNPLHSPAALVSGGLGRARLITLMNRQLLLDVLPAPAPSLNNYIAGPNGEALAAVRALKPGRALYIWGAAGCGRTHLLRALTARTDAVFIDPATGENMLRRLAEADSKSPMPHFVAVDDVHRMDDSRQAALFALYNRWRESAATGRAFALALAGDRAPLSMPLREDLRTRLGWDLVFRLDPLSDEDKLAALSAQAAERGLHLAPEIINWMLTHHERDIRKLAALLDALDRYSLATGRPITLPLLRAMLADPDLHRT